MITHFAAENLRCFPRIEVDCKPEENLFTGPNGSGKTTLLEAIYLATTGRSFRTPLLKSVIREGSSYARVELTYRANEIQHTLTWFHDQTQRRLLRDGDAITTDTLLRSLPSVQISLEDLQLIRGAPKLRRHFLDLLASQLDPTYLHHLARYHKAMRHRNALLKSHALDSIAPWEEQMALAASQVVEVRRSLVQELSTRTETLYGEMGGEKKKVSLHYQTPAPPSKEDLTAYFREKYCVLREKEQILGLTLTGPHRDDLSWELNERLIKHHGSEGEQRALIISAKLSSALLFEERGSCPVLLIDDLQATLDPERRARLEILIAEHKQVFVTRATGPSAALSQSR